MQQPSAVGDADVPESVARYRYRIYWFVSLLILFALAFVVVWAGKHQEVLGIYVAATVLFTAGYLFFIKRRTRLAASIHLLGSIGAIAFSAMRDGQSGSEILWLMPTSSMISAYLLNRKQWRFFTGLCVVCVIGVCLSETVWVVPDRMPRTTTLVFAFQTITLLTYASFALISMGSIERLIVRVDDNNLALDRSKREIDNSLNVKARFLAGISSETQDPMQQILRQVALAKKEALPEHQREALTMIEDNIGIMVHMVRNIEEYANIQNGNLELSVSESGVVGFLDELRMQWDPRMREHGVTFEVKGEPHSGEILRSDVESVRSIVDHLLKNAMDHSPGGRVQLAVNVQVSHLEISVQDEGPGMGSKDAEELFEAFAREESASVDSRRGLGLGLAIVKSRLELLGGSIEVSPAPHKGSVFRVRIPLQGELVYKLAS